MLQIVTLDSVRTKVGPGYTDPLDGSTTFIVDEPYTIAPLKLNLMKTKVSKGSVYDLKYTLSPNAPPHFFVQAASGVLYGKFDAAGTYEFQLMAVDAGGMPDVVESFAFEVKEHGAFQVLGYTSLDTESKYDVNCFKMQSCLSRSLTIAFADYTQPSTTTQYAIGDTYLFAPVLIDTVANTFDAKEDLRFAVGGAPPGFLFDPSDGFMQGTPTTSGEYKMRRYAVDRTKRKALVDTITLIIAPHDADVEAYGPNGMGCGDGVAADEIPFDGSFSCDCSTTRFEGENCNVLSAASSDGGEGSPSTVVGGVVGGMLILFLLIFAVQHRFVQK